MLHHIFRHVTISFRGHFSKIATSVAKAVAKPTGNIAVKSAAKSTAAAAAATIAAAAATIAAAAARKKLIEKNREK